MFTGIVREVGRVERIREADDGRVIEIRAPGIREGLSVGGSVAVDGACLTAEALTETGFRATVVGTTLSRTILGSYAEGSRPNLEPALRVGDRMEGHWVQGHVDGIGTVAGLRRAGEHRLLDVEIPPEVLHQTVLHGSIAINGVSLTVNALPGEGICQTALVPHTWAATNLSELSPGDPVNVEGDLIGKHVGRWMAERGGGTGG